MPYANVPESLWGKMDSCVEQVEGKVDNAYAVCYASIVEGKELKQLIEEHSKENGEKAGARHSGNDLTDIQAIHDLTVRQGAKCKEGEESKSVSKDNGYYAEPVTSVAYLNYGGATSFDDVDAYADALEETSSINSLTDTFNSLVENVMRSPEVKDKKAAMTRLAGEFQKRISSEAKKEIASQHVTLPEKVKQFLRSTFTSNGQKEVALQSTIKAVTSSETGKLCLLLQTTNAFQDRDKQIFMDKALQEYAARATPGSPVDYWHTNWDIGTVIWTGYGEKALFELVEPADNLPSQELVAHVAQHPTYWGASHRFHYSPEDLKNNVFSRLNKSKSTLLPTSAASNPFTAAGAVTKEQIMDTRKLDELKSILSPEGYAAALAFVESEEGKSRRLQEAGVAHKEAGPQPDPPQRPPEPAPPPEPPAPTPPKEPVPNPFENLSAVLEQHLKPISERLAALEQKEKAREDLPRNANLLNVVPASKSASTLISSDLLKQDEKPEDEPMLRSLGMMFGGAFAMPQEGK